MSRTYRAKRDSGWHSYVGAPKGYYEMEWATMWGRGWVFIPLDPVKDRKKIRQQLWQSTKESSNANERSPGKEYRRNRHRELRSITREELHKFKAIPDYEPMIPNNPISCKWDWR